MLLIWLTIAPSLTAQANNLLDSSASAPYLITDSPLNTRAAKFAFTSDITFTPSFTAYLPLISAFVPELTGDIYGQVTYQGAPVGGISVTLFLWYNPTTYSRWLTTTTKTDGTYRFTGVRDLGSNYYYRVLYEGDLEGKLLRHAAGLSVADRLGVLGDARALARGGDMAASAERSGATSRPEL